MGLAPMDFRLNLQSDLVEQLDANPPLCVETGTSVREVFRLLKQEGRGSVLVCRDGMLVGLFTERDALRMMADSDTLDVPVEQRMTREPVTVSYHDSVEESIARMSLGGYRRLPIVNDQGQPVGMLSVRNILRYVVEHFPLTIYTLPPTPDLATKDREGA